MKFLAVLILFLALSSPLYALSYTQDIGESEIVTDRDPVTGKPKPPSRLKIYKKKVDEKFSFGMVNFLTGWTEIIGEPLARAEEKQGRKNRALAVMGGLGIGLLNGCLDTVGGAANFLTAPVPQFRIPLPQNGVDLEKMTGSSSLR